MDERTKFYMEHGWDNELVAKLVGILEDEFETTIDIIEVLEDIDLAITKAEARADKVGSEYVRASEHVAGLAKRVEELEENIADAVADAERFKADNARLRAALEAAAEYAWQSEVIEPQMRDLLIGEDNEYTDKRDWLDAKIAEWMEAQP